MKKKIAIFTILCLLLVIHIGYSIYRLCECFNFLDSYSISIFDFHLLFDKETTIYNYTYKTQLTLIVYFLSSSALSLYIIVSKFIAIFKNTNLSNFTKYTYEEYKAIMDKKKAEKQEKKKQKLQQQLNDLDKTE